ncbi:MAG: hypothetical protein CMF99_00510 [Candidatus Marinimicrobia bacterium]|nr:hypothetical protein [Candidatus Neomarinimicrobiota bacterium]|tara:strand:- start:2126 stop:2791 length:666 start_codon:yes stop_codon:yes gene_type:complete
MNPETDFSVRPFLGGYDKNFTYLITCSHTGSNVLIDAAIPINQIMPLISIPPMALLITHTHSDHIRYINDYITTFPEMIIYGHSESALMYKIKNFRIIKHQQKFKLGRLPFTSIYTPGHYFDSICYLLKPTLFTGDTLFVGRTGRVISQRSNIKELFHSIYERLLILSKDLRIYPGHDYGKQPSIKIKNNINISPLLRAKNLGDFIKIMEEYELNRTLDNV